MEPPARVVTFNCERGALPARRVKGVSTSIGRVQVLSISVKQ